MISKATAERVLAEAVRTGGDFAELFMEDTRSSSLGLVDGAIDSANTGRRHGAGIRIYNGLESVYVHTNDTSEAGLIRAARQAASAVGSGDTARDIALTGSIARNIHAIERLPMDVSGAEKARLAHAAYRAAKDFDSTIKQVRVSLTGKESDVLIANTDGLLCADGLFTATYTKPMRQSEGVWKELNRLDMRTGNRRGDNRLDCRTGAVSQGKRDCTAKA